MSDLFEGAKPAPLSCRVAVDPIAQELAKAFDYDFSGLSVFQPPFMPKPPADYGIGLIVGPSGSGKTTLLKTIGEIKRPEWRADLSVASHFSSAEEARDKLGAVGLNSIPSMLRPYDVLSTGEKFRADLAALLSDGAVIDEFTSVVDRTVAKSCSHALRRYVDDGKVQRVTLASCHYDIIEWLRPDWVFDTKTGEYAGRGSHQRPIIEIELLPCTTAAWSVFRQHHYLDDNLNQSARCWLAFWEGVMVGFVAVIAMPNGNLKRAWRGHRTVVLPDFQGLGIGVRISDAIGEIILREGGRYFSKTANHRMGEYRERSPLWVPTSKNRKARPDYSSDRPTKEASYKRRHIERNCYSHEYKGGAA